jgi:DNA-binding transcriptional ArsR family regulator
VVNNLDGVYSALADPTRRAMIERLGSGPLSVTELGEPLTMTLAAVGKHVAALEAAGLVRTSKKGRVRTCALVPGAVSEASGWLVAQEAFWTSRIDALEQYLKETS